MKIQKKTGTAYSRFKREQADETEGPSYRELTPEEKKDFQKLLHKLKKQIAEDKEQGHYRYKALAYGSLELYMFEAKKIIRITDNHDTFAIISGRIEDYQMWGHQLNLYKNAVAKRNYAEKKKLQDLDKLNLHD